ncbi:MAG: hypothetical protein ABI298_02120 [Acidimicrobiales bacterium]
MNVFESRAKFLRFVSRGAVPLVLVASGLMIGVAAPAGAAANDGSGKMTSSVSSVPYGSTGHTITFTYTAASGGVYEGGVHLLVPAGWSPPSTTGSAAGYTTVSKGTLSIDGQAIVDLGVSLTEGKTLTITYGSKALKGPGATATTTVGPNSWLSYEKSTSGGTETQLAKSPTITVTQTLATPLAPNITLVSPTSIIVTFTANPNAKYSDVIVYQASSKAVVKEVTGNTSGTETIAGLVAGDSYYATITSVGNETVYFTSAPGAHSVSVTPGILTVSAKNAFFAAGHPVAVTSVVSGLQTSDTAAVTTATYTYTGVGTTVYAASSVAPSAVGTYSVLPGNATVVVTPNTDQGIYAKTYNYVAGSLSITAPSKAKLRAIRVAGGAWSGRTVTVVVIGAGFTGQPRIISSTGHRTIARVFRDSGTRLSVRVTVRSGTPRGVHTFKIIFANHKSVNVHYNQF